MIFRYDFKISELLFRVESPRKLQIPECFQAFIANEILTKEPDIKLEIIFQTMDILSEPDIKMLAPNVYTLNNRIITRCLWRDGKYIIRRESVGREIPCQLFIPEDFAEDFCKNGNWLMYIALERMLIPFQRIIIHASAVIYDGKAYVFTAQSGGGKSTHAALWEKHFGAKVLNGDKVLIELKDGQAIAHGNPIAGSSGIYNNDAAPIAAVFVLKKGLCNQITPVSGRNALLTLYSEAIKSIWDDEFNKNVLDLVAQLQKITPVKKLECLPDKSAVECILHYGEE